MKKHSRFLASITLILIFLLLLPVNRHIVRAGSDGLAVVITYPSEGETFYVGPDALIYSIQVSGYVTGGDNTAPYQVRLEILQGELIYGTQDILTQEDGSFKFFVTANPDGILRGFVTFERDCPQCHFRSELKFPPGTVLLRVRASSNSGEEALAERNIVIDKSGFKNVNVQVVPAEADGILPPDLDVVASTWLYLWRARSSSGITDEFGKGRVQVEALSEAPTRYVFRLEPELVNGQLFEGVKGVEVILTPGTETIDPIVLQVRSRWGSIDGELAGEALSNPVAVDAIYLTDGQRFSTKTSSSGSFRFENVPIGSYLVFADPEALNMQSLAADVQEVDLRPDGAGSVRLKLTTKLQAIIQGKVMGVENEWLPFAWVSVVDMSQSSSIHPGTGDFSMYGLPDGAATITVTAPGFYSQVQSLENAADHPEGYDFQLLPQPETRNFPWGSGHVIIPAETQVSLGTQNMTLTRGWLWGEAGDSTKLTISAAGFEIVLDQAKFALEFLPGEAAWLYLVSGEASVSSDQSGQPVVMSGGQLLSLSSPILPAPVTFDALTVQAFQTMSESSISTVWEPSLLAQMKNRLTLIGVTTAQVITFITYLGVLLSLVGLPIVALQWWRKHKRSA